MSNIDYSSQLRPRQSNKDTPHPSSLAYLEQPSYYRTDTVLEKDDSSECPIQPMGYSQSQNPEFVHSDVHEVDLAVTPRNVPLRNDAIASTTVIPRPATNTDPSIIALFQVMKHNYSKILNG